MSGKSSDNCFYTWYVIFSELGAHKNLVRLGMLHAYINESAKVAGLKFRDIIYM